MKFDSKQIEMKATIEFTEDELRVLYQLFDGYVAYAAQVAREVPHRFPGGPAQVSEVCTRFQHAVHGALKSMSDARDVFAGRKIVLSPERHEQLLKLAAEKVRA
jgi:hypothetical protein